ncbi:GFA family protein [Ancylobacter polymorphus]|uniref:GFA family protein n=1 Tax=Ancylobacter polymorphus TaxID=223390 RepID=A0A9E7A9K4_9HYPH|nr:GFA family protein [Ancylobacter polymorphus]UOK73309.1 GFA family protein [Ancylobacter polymorphus]
MRIRGQCHCGAIAYEAEVEPDNVAICHCRDCQRLSGGAFRANVSAPAAGFRIISGEPTRYLKTADSGGKRAHAFCGTCGSPIYSCAAEAPTRYSLRIGCLDAPEEVGRPARQIWTKRRLSWLPPLSDVPECEGQP